MRKTAILLLTILYLTMSSGVIVNFHYCMGDLAEVEWGLKHDDTCPKCGMKDAEGCCENKYEVVKLEQEHQMTKLASLMPPAYVAVEPSSPALPSLSTLPASSVSPYLSFDEYSGIERYVLYRVFRI